MNQRTHETTDLNVGHGRHFEVSLEEIGLSFFSVTFVDFIDGKADLMVRNEM